MLHAFHNGSQHRARWTRSRASACTTRARARSCGPSSRRTCCPSCAPTWASTPTSWTARPWCATCGWTARRASPADGKKQWQEYRTVAVVGTGRGGVHRFALDLTRLLGREPGRRRRPCVPDQAGDFLWMWPQPCDPLALQVGESFTNFAPRPPPIGPVALTAGGGRRPAATVWPHGGSPRDALDDQQHPRARAVGRVPQRRLSTEHCCAAAAWPSWTSAAATPCGASSTGTGKRRSEHLRYPIGAGCRCWTSAGADSPSDGRRLPVRHGHGGRLRRAAVDGALLEAGHVGQPHAAGEQLVRRALLPRGQPARARPRTPRPCARPSAT